jgi:hypothetical protein
MAAGSHSTILQQLEGRSLRACLGVFRCDWPNRVGTMEYSTSSIMSDGVAACRRSARATTSAVHVAVLLLTACGFPRPPDVGDDGGSSEPGTAVRVSPSGDDANDGMNLPVKTLKHALGLAAANTQISKVILATGRYSADSGETFPYTIQANLLVIGPAGGGAIVAGNGSEPALLLRDASLRDMEFESFGVVIDSTGATSLTNVRVRGSSTAVRGHAGAALTINNLDITGAASACASGILLNDTADLKVNMLATRGLGTMLDSRDHTTSELVNVNVAGDLACANSVIKITSDRTFSLRDSLLDMGNGGMNIASPPSGPQTNATLTGVSIHNIKGSAIGLAHASLQMIGGELAHNGMTGPVISAFDATLSLMDVTITQNPGLVTYLQKTITTLRRCTVIGNGGGLDISVADPSVTDLGTATSAGDNTFQSNSRELTIEGSDFSPLREVNAIGNTWNPSVQDADGAGHYDPTLVVPGSSSGIFGPNYALTGSMISLRL